MGNLELTPNEREAAADRLAAGVATFIDLLAIAFAGPPTSVAANFLNGLRRRSVRQARDILLDELRLASVPLDQAVQSDDLLDVIYRYHRAAEANAARRNIRLLAQLIVGLQCEGDLVSDAFDAYANLVAQLTREQIIILARFHAAYEREVASNPDTNKATSEAWRVVELELVPAVIASKEYMRAVLGQLAGLGLLLPSSGFGTLIYPPSPILSELMRLVDLERAALE